MVRSNCDKKCGEVVVILLRKPAYPAIQAIEMPCKSNFFMIKLIYSGKNILNRSL
jgi:hypothetical protein